MSRRDMVETLEICMRRIASGSTIDAVVADYPDQAGELRELLEIFLAAQPLDPPVRVPAAAMANSRKRLLARAEQLKSSPRPFLLWSGLRFFREHFASAAFVMVMVALLVVALGSVGALPGDGLYPVKLAAERAGVSLAASDAARLEREAGFDTRRAEEVARMIQEKRSGAVAFGGFLTNREVEGWQAAGIPLQIAPALDQQAQGLAGAFVEIQGSLGNDGTVAVAALDPLLSSLQGVIQQMDAGGWTVDGKTVRVTAITKVSGTPREGSRVVIQAARTTDENQLLAVTIEVADDSQVSPTARSTETPSATATPDPTKTRTPTWTATATRAVTRTPEPRQTETSSSDDHDDDHKTPEPGDDDHDGNDDGDNSGKITDEPDDEDHSGSGSSGIGNSGSD